MVKFGIGLLLSASLLYAQPVHLTSDEVPLEKPTSLEVSIESPIEKNIISNANDASDENDANHENVQEETQEIDEFHSLNGLSLSDSKEIIREKQGAPQSIDSDPYLQDQQEWKYPSMVVGFYKDSIEYISVISNVKNLEMNGQSTRMDKQALKERLGEPDHIAEDGVVYKRGNKALKIFLNQETGDLRSVDLFYVH